MLGGWRAEHLDPLDLVRGDRLEREPRGHPLAVDEDLREPGPIPRIRISPPRPGARRA
jgi:hypothetical protein